MKYILAKRHRSLVERFARARTLLGLDYDGTLVNPPRQQLRRRTRDLLQRLTKRHPIGIISARARRDAQRRVRGLPIARVVGSHGVDWPRPLPGAPRLRRRVARWQAELLEVVRAAGGRIENKAYSLTVDCDSPHDVKRVLKAVHDTLPRLRGARILMGHEPSVHLVPAGGPNKYEALVRMRDQLGCEGCVYMGDDETDEDVFEHRDPQRLLAIRVGRSLSSRAEYYVHREKEIDRVLALLARESG